MRDLDAEYEAFRKQRRDQAVNFLKSALGEKLRELHHIKEDEIWAENIKHGNTIHDLTHDNIAHLCSHKRHALKNQVDENLAEGTVYLMKQHKKTHDARLEVEQNIRNT